jgi:hypothetical protein
MPAPIPLTSSRCPNYITEGEIAGCVTELQILLNNHGAGLAVYGDFGPMTLAAVGLDCSGFSRWIYGPRVWTGRPRRRQHEQPHQRNDAGLVTRTR